MLAVSLALAGSMASAASAARYKSEFTTGKTEFTGSNSGLGNHVFEASAKVVCKGVEVAGGFTTPAVSISTSTVGYKECTVAGQTATVNMNGCGYIFAEPTGSASPFSISNIEITCPTGKEIVVTATTSGCTIKIATQHHLGPLAYNQAGPPKTIKILISYGNLESRSSGGICGAAGPHTGGSYSGEIALNGYKNFAHTEPTGIFVG